MNADSDLPFYPYDHETDFEAVQRIWREVGWLNPDNPKSEEIMENHVLAGSAFVAKIDGEAECLVLTAPGTIRHLGAVVPFSGVTGVTTSRVARKQGFAKRLTARAIAESADAGAMVSGLGIFEQGFYNLLGYGNGCYEYFVTLDPQTLTVAPATRSPKRLTADDSEAMHQCRLTRMRTHGSITLTSSKVTRSDTLQVKHGFGLGYYDGENGELSHFLWGSASGEHGPYTIHCMAYRSYTQCLELLGVVKNLGDQVRSVRMMEPPGIQLQDVVKQPVHGKMITRDSKFSTRTAALANWQKRICDVPGCLERTHLNCDELKFNLELDDPIARYLAEDSAWRGVGGGYVVTLGQTSGAEPGRDDSLPTLDATVNAFTRLWLGVRPATGLAATDTLAGPPELLRELDRAFCLPIPMRDWEY